MSLPTPITRKESYLAAIAGEEVQVPEKPITREEAYLDAIVKGGGGGEIIVDPVPTEGSTNAVSSGGTYTALEGKLNASEKGTASGVAELDANGKVLSSQLPSFVDDVVEGYYDSETDRFYEESTFETVIDPVGGKSWVDIPANKSYRWTGTVYVRVDEGVQLGETSNSAFRGDWGKALKDTMGTGTLDTTAQTVIPAINEVKDDMPTALSDLTDDATHRLVTDTEKSTWNGKADTADITNAISALDVSSVGGTGKYISEISEADGKIIATAETMDDVPTENSNAPVKSGGIKTAIDDSVSLKTATGNPITLTDAANTNAEKLLMTIEPVQSGSGDPSPTNVRPISGISEAALVRDGKNLVEDTLTGVSINANGYLLTSATYSMQIAKVKAGVTYTVTSDELLVAGFFNTKPTQGNTTYNGERIADAPKTFISPIDGYVAFRTSNGYSTPQLEVGSISTDYEAPVTPATATITFGQTVYGGSVNFKTGEVTVTHVFKSGTISSLVTQTHEAKYQQGGEGRNKNLCDKLPYEYHLGANPHFFFENNRLITRGVDGSVEIQLCYELATPTTLTLTPAELELLKGNNTITANGAEISIEYYPDNAIGALAERVDDVQEQIATKANTADVNVALAKKADVTTVTIPRFIPSQAGWRRICKIKPISGMSTVDAMVYIGGAWTNGQPPSASLAVSIMGSSTSLTLLSSAIGDSNKMTDIRLVSDSSGAYWVDVYFPAYSSNTGIFKLTFTGDIAVSDIQNPISITTDATAATDEVSLNQKVNGTVLTDKSSMIADLVSGKVDRFVSSSGGTSQTIDVGIVTTTNRMFLLSAGYSAQNGDYYVFGLIFIDYAGNIKYISLKDTQMTISVTYTDGIVSFTFSDPPYSNAVLIRLS